MPGTGRQPRRGPALRRSRPAAAAPPRTLPAPAISASAVASHPQAFDQRHDAQAAPAATTGRRRRQSRAAVATVSSSSRTISASRLCRTRRAQIAASQPDPMTAETSARIAMPPIWSASVWTKAAAVKKGRSSAATTSRRCMRPLLLAAHRRRAPAARRRPPDRQASHADLEANIFNATHSHLYRFADRFLVNAETRIQRLRKG